MDAATLQQFVLGVLAGMGAPANTSNVQLLTNWATQNENTAAQNNPLATKQKMAGSYDLPGNSPGDPNKVQQYKTLADGIAATVRTLNNGRYGDIVGALKAGTGWESNINGALQTGLHTWSGQGYVQVKNGGGSGTLSPEQWADMSPEGIAARNQTLAANASGGTAGITRTPIDLKQFAANNGMPPAWVNDPQLGPLLQSWDNGDLSDEQFYAAARQTTLWKNTPASVRGFAADQATDPATLRQTIGANAAVVDKLAHQLGVTLTPQIEWDLGTRAITEKWSNAQLQAQIAAQFKYTEGQTYGGEAGTDIQSLSDLYAAYALPASPQTLQQKLSLILAGNSTVDQFKQTLASQAKSMYGTNPDLAAALDRGETVDQAMSTYRDAAVNTLGIAPTDVNWLNPKWGKALTGSIDPATGRTTPMSVFDWQKNLQTDPVYGYSRTKNGIAQGQNIRDQLQQAFTGQGGI